MQEHTSSTLGIHASSDQCKVVTRRIKLLDNFQVNNRATCYCENYGTRITLNVLLILAFCAKVSLKNGIFWDVMQCGSCKNQRFGGIKRLLHQGDKNRSTRNNASCN
jgi:hypothetical protein